MMTEGLGESWGQRSHGFYVKLWNLIAAHLPKLFSVQARGQSSVWLTCALPAAPYFSSPEPARGPSFSPCDPPAPGTHVRPCDSRLRALGRLTPSLVSASFSLSWSQRTCRIHHDRTPVCPSLTISSCSPLFPSQLCWKRSFHSHPFLRLVTCFHLTWRLTITWHGAWLRDLLLPWNSLFFVTSAAPSLPVSPPEVSSPRSSWRGYFSWI